VTVGELNAAKRRALRIFDHWVGVTGVLGDGYRWEVESIIEDAVEIGAQHALNDMRLLEAETEIAVGIAADAAQRSESNDGG
jgi:hypothetical protein